jgi:hypothetical protein
MLNRRCTVGALSLLTALAACDDAATAPDKGTLSVVIAGLPVGVQSLVTITGPKSFSRVVESSSTLTALPFGTYTVVASAVTAVFGSRRPRRRRPSSCPAPCPQRVPSHMRPPPRVLP